MKVPNVPDQDQELGVQVAQQSNLAVEIPAEVAEMFNIADNMEGVVPRLPQIAIIHAGQLFEMPDESKVETFEGIILDQHPANAWWKPKEEGEGAGDKEKNKVPNCYSMNAITPDDRCENKQNDKCGDCNQNQFGSDSKTGKGKACKNMKRLHILMEGSLLPRRLTIPPTSIKSFEYYMTGLVDRGLPYPTVVSVFSLDKKEVAEFKYSEVKIIKNRVLVREELIAVAGFIKQYKDAARQQEINKEEYESEEPTEKPDISEPDIPF